MAACPPKEADEKVPDKLRSNFSLINQPFERNVDGNGENKPRGCDMSKKLHRDEASAAKENGDELQKLSDDEFKNLLQEACCLSSNPNSGNQSKLLRKLISETDIKDPECSRNFSKTWSYRKESRKHADRRARLDSYGHAVGASAASCTTQGGSLQNLHGKPESKKLHKSGSLITFPAATPVNSDTTRELAQLKALLAENPFKLSSSSSSSFGKSKSQSSSAASAPIVSTASEYPVALKSKFHRTWSECPCDTSDTAKDPSLRHHFRKCHSVDAHPRPENVSHDAKDKDVHWLRGNLSKFSSKSTADGDDQRNGDCSAIEMMDVDGSNDEPESESSPLLKDSANCGSQGVVRGTMRPYGSIDVPKIKIGSTPLDVDTSISIPLMLKTHSSDSTTAHTENWSSGNCVKENYGIYRLSSSDSVSITGFVGSSTNELRTGESNQDKRKKDSKTENEDGKSTISFRSLDENGNPLILCTSETNSKTVDLMSTMNPVVLSHTMDRDGSTDGNIQKRKAKKAKLNSRQKDIRPEEIEGYFGALAVEDILKRFNSLESLEDSKKGNHKDCYKQQGTKTKKVLSNRDVSKKNLENDFGQMNGTKDGIISRNKMDNDATSNGRNTGSNLNGPKKSLNHIADCDIVLNRNAKQITSEIQSSNGVTPNSICDKAGDNGSLNIYSHLLKPSADVHFAIVTDAKVLPLTCIVDIKEVSATTGCPPSDEGVNHFDSQAVKSSGGSLNPTTPLSSFVEDFYANPDVPVVVEDSEFHEVKKKKKKKPRSGLSFKNDAGSHYRYYSYGGANSGGGGGVGGPGGSSSNTYSSAAGSGVGNTNGRRETPSSWNDLRPLSHHRNQRGCPEDVRRKSTSSVPPSEHSSADNSDVESVHSLPVSSTTPKPVINKTSSSSSCTPQASYADIAKMSTSVSAPSRKSLSSCPFKVGMSYQRSGMMVAHVSTATTTTTAATTAAAAIVLFEMKRDASTATDDCLSYCDAVALPSQTEPCDDKKPDKTLTENVAVVCHLGEKVAAVKELSMNECVTENGPRILSCNPNCDQDKEKESHCSSSGHGPSFVPDSPQQTSAPEVPLVEPQDGSDGATTMTFEDDSLQPSPKDHQPDTDSCSVDTVPSPLESGDAVVPADVLYVSQSSGSSRSYPGVIFVGAMDLCEDLPGVTFGFDVNEELLRMTSIEIAGSQPPMVQEVARTEVCTPEVVVVHGEDGRDCLRFASESSPIAASQHSGQQEAVLFSAVDAAPSSSTSDVDAAAAAVDSIEAPPRSSDLLADEMNNVNYLNIVDYIGNAWDGIQEEFQKESSSGSSNWPSKVQYYKP